VVAGVAFGSKAGYIWMGIGIVIVAISSHFVLNKLSPGAFVEMDYIMAPETWIMQTTTYAVQCVILLFTIGRIHKRLAASLTKASQQSIALSESESKYRLLAENMRDMIFIQDMDLTIIYASPSMERLLGYNQDELGELTMAQTMTPESLKKARATFFHYVDMTQNKTREEILSLDIPSSEFEYVRKDGTSFWGEMKQGFLVDHEGNLIGAQGVIRDISDRVQAQKQSKELEQQLQRGERLQAIGQLAGGVAHDFNNQLAGIIAFAELIKLHPNGERTTEFANRILQASQNAANLTGKLLAFARRGSVEHAPVDLHESIDETIAILERSIDKTISIKRQMEAPSAWVMGDASQLQNALLNLALNARDALTKGGVILFKTRIITTDRKETTNHNKGGQKNLEISVKDNGTGIAPAIIDRVFEPFFTTKKLGSGSGMGLAAVYGTVKAHGGSIDLVSEPDKGSTFTITLPSTENPNSMNKDSQHKNLVPGHGQIMIVDDEENLGEGLSAMLASLGYEPVLFNSGVQAIEYFLKHNQDIRFVLLDLILPEMNGVEVFREMQKINDTVMVLLISGYSSDSDVQILLDQGAAGFIKKPFVLRELSEKITEIIGHDDETN